MFRFWSSAHMGGLPAGGGGNVYARSSDDLLVETTEAPAFVPRNAGVAAAPRQWLAHTSARALGPVPRAPAVSVAGLCSLGPETGARGASGCW